MLLTTYREIQGKELLLLILGVFLYACTDEFHQLFMDGRAGQFKDVLIDTAGGSTGILLWHVIRDGFRQHT